MKTERDNIVADIVANEITNKEKYRKLDEESYLDYGTRVHIQLENAIEERLKENGNPKSTN